MQSAMDNKRRAADAIVERLSAHAVRQVFSVAGESFLDVLDALYDARSRLQIVTCRHEAAAANMAEACGKLTGRAGVAFVTRGPGLTHASIGVHTAKQDATPMVLFVGEISRQDRYRRAFQEVDLAVTFADLAKGVLQIDLPERAGELVDRAFQLAESGRPGPVIVGLPEDVLGAPCPALPGAAGKRGALGLPGVEPGALEAVATKLRAARRPLLWVGGSRWDSDAVAALRRLAEGWLLPVITSFRRKDLFANDHACYAGEVGFGASAGMIQRLRDADLLLVIGAALGDVETGGYQWLDRHTTASRLIHAHPDADTLSAVFPAQIAIQASPGALTAQLAELAPAGHEGFAWAEWTRAARAAQVAFMQPVEVMGAVNLSLIFRELRAALPATALISNGAGNYAAWLHRFYSHDAYPTQVGPGSGAMGYAVPAALAAKISFPEREVVCVAGDGCFLMSCQELATAAALALKVIFIVVNNQTYGTIRMHQEMRFPGRAVATALTNPDFVALARAYGLAGWRVDKTGDFAAALAAARAHQGPALIELVTSIEDIAPERRLTA
ncbi:MAG: thiamine pyrophosphate-dependent enzyme [Steroidobacterales bacterium]